MKNNIVDLQNHLFETIERLKNNNDPKAEPCEKIALDDARMICSAADCIIDSVRVQNEFLSIVGKAENPTAISNMIPKALENKEA